MYEIAVAETYPNGNILWYKDICIKEDKAWMIAGNYNALYELSISSNEIHYLGSFLGESLFGKQLYGKIFNCFDKIIAVPSYADGIGIYDLKQNEFRRITIPVSEVKPRNANKFKSAIQYENKIFMFPGYYSYILELDVYSEKIEIYDEWYTNYLRNGEQKSYLQFYDDVAVIDNNAYLISAQYNIIFRFDMITSQYEFNKVGMGTLITLAHDGSNFWTANTNGQLFKWNPKTNETAIINIAKEDKKEIYVFSGFVGNFLVLIPSASNIALYVNTLDNTVEEREFLLDDSKEYTSFDCHRFYFAKTISKEKILVLDRNDRRLKTFEMNGLMDWKREIVDDSDFANKKRDIEEYYQYYISFNEKISGEKKGVSLSENDIFNVNGLIYLIENFKQASLRNDGENIGINIYNKLKGVWRE